jgi:hypothetical protein
MECIYKNFRIKIPLKKIALDWEVQGDRIFLPHTWISVPLHGTDLTARQKNAGMTESKNQ